jgi:hypothetical protein
MRNGSSKCSTHLWLELFLMSRQCAFKINVFSSLNSDNLSYRQCSENLPIHVAMHISILYIVHFSDNVHIQIVFLSHEDVSVYRSIHSTFIIGLYTRFSQ